MFQANKVRSKEAKTRATLLLSAGLAGSLALSGCSPELLQSDQKRACFKTIVGFSNVKKQPTHTVRDSVLESMASPIGGGIKGKALDDYSGLSNTSDAILYQLASDHPNATLPENGQTDDDRYDGNSFWYCLQNKKINPSTAIEIKANEATILTSQATQP
jgi:hypothetical protein